MSLIPVCEHAPTAHAEHVDRQKLRSLDERPERENQTVGVAFFNALWRDFIKGLTLRYVHVLFLRPNIEFAVQLKHRTKR